MNDNDRKKILLGILNDSLNQDSIDVGKLANDIESLYTALEHTSRGFNESYFNLWDTLEIIGADCYESGTPLTEQMLLDIKELSNKLRSEVIKDLSQ